MHPWWSPGLGSNTRGGTSVQVHVPNVMTLWITWCVQFHSRAMGLTGYELSYDKQPFVRHYRFITAHNVTKFPSALPMQRAQFNECIGIRVRQPLRHIEGPAAREKFRQVCIVVHTLGVPHVVYPPRLQHSHADAKHHVAWEALHQVLTIVLLQAQSHALQDGLEHEIPNRHGGRTIRGAPKEALPNTEGLHKVTQCLFRRQGVAAKAVQAFLKKKKQDTMDHFTALCKGRSDRSS